MAVDRPRSLRRSACLIRGYMMTRHLGSLLLAALFLAAPGARAQETGLAPLPTDAGAALEAICPLGTRSGTLALPTDRPPGKDEASQASRVDSLCEQKQQIQTLLSGNQDQLRKFNAYFRDFYQL